MKSTYLCVAVLLGLWCTSSVARAQTPDDPVVIVPGIGASMNWNVMFTENPTITTEGWKFTPGVRQYDQLTQALEDSGLTENEDFFVAFYDWRQHNEFSAENYLIPVIDKALQHSSSGKVDIIAHSMGGLVARSYIQGSSYRDDVDQFILLGTPNFGSSDVYTLWEGGSIPDNWDTAQKYIMGTYIWYMTKVTDQTEDAYDTIHGFVPSVKELMPTYSYITDKDSGSYTEYWEMQEVNQYLESLNGGTALFVLINRVLGGITVFAGTGESTMGDIPIVAHTEEDGKLWVDGKPDPLSPERNDSDGDNRVLTKSAALPDEPPVPVKADPWWRKLFAFIPKAEAQFLLYDYREIASKHGDIPTLAIPEIFDVLGLGDPGNYAPIAEAEEELSFWFASPIAVSVTDPQGRTITRTSNNIPGAIYDGEDDPRGLKMVIIENPEPGAYIVELTGLADGSYHFATAHFKQDTPGTETTVEKTIALNEQIGYTVTFNPTTPGAVVISDPYVPDTDEQPQDPVALLGELITNIQNLKESGAITKKLSLALLLPLTTAKESLIQAEKLLASSHPHKERNAKILRQFALLNLNIFIGIVDRNKVTLGDTLAADLKTGAVTIINLIKELIS